MNTTTIPTTVEEADALLESIGMTELVEDYECNELGHVYTLRNGDTIVVTSPHGFEYTLENGGTIAATHAAHFHTPDE